MKNNNILLSDILSTNSSPKKIKEALNLFSKHPLTDAPVCWASSAPSVLATSGRVTRPRWDEEAVDVTLTATVGKEKQSFDFTVLPDEYVGDNMAKSDEKFFGFYYNGNWTFPGELRYDDFPELASVKEAAKIGNYEKAKENFLLYIRKKISNSNIDNFSRNTLYADYMINGASENGSNDYCTSEAYVTSSEYQKIEVPLISHGIKAGAPRTYCLISKYRDSVTLNFAGSMYSDESLRPVLLVYVNDLPRYYPAVKSATIRGGEYKNAHFGTSEELTVRMFGEFFGNETYRALLQFDLSDIAEKDTIGKVTLILHAKKSNDYSEEKAFYVIKEPNISWNPETVSWLDISGLYYNFNGVDGGNPWKKIEGANVEYLCQTIRFGKLGYAAAEYRHTGDEKYAYSIISNMTRFIASKDCLYINSLHSNLRLYTWISLFKNVISSKYMTPDICTAIVKRFFTSISAHADDKSAKHNAAVSKFSHVISAASFFNEYTDSERCKHVGIDFFNSNIVKDFFPDGAYAEDTGMYNGISHREYTSVKRMLYNEGIKCSEEFDKRLRLGAYYNLLLRGPDGELMGFGDESTQGKREFGNYAEFDKWYSDPVLKYLDTRGKEGTKPDFTSVLFPSSTYVFLRSDWTPDAQMLFTNVRHGSCHAHDDDNGIILFGYGKNLLADSGYIDYDNTPQRQLGCSTLMHNTVEINNVSQQSFGAWQLVQDDVGVTNDFSANDNFDFVSQTSFGYQHIGNEHTRSITFIKPDFYIVSDIMRPVDKNSANSYKQLWHTTPHSGLYTKDGNIYSNYSEPGNLIIANADNAELKEGKGPYTISYGGAAVAPYAYYCKEGEGNVTFDTVLLPYKSEKSDLRVERIDLGVPTSEATALKISIDKDGNKSTVYYMLQYESIGERAFEKYKSNAKMAVVTENECGEPCEFIMYKGDYIKSLNGNILKKN